MKLILSLVLGAVLLCGAALAGEQNQSDDPASQKKNMSYSLGYNTGSGLKKNSVELDLDVFIQALRAGYAGEKSRMTDEEMRGALAPFRMKAALAEDEEKKNLAERRKMLAEKNRKEGEAFLAENAKKSGVVTRPSGLQYVAEAEGSGRNPALSNKVKVNYRSMLIDGTVIDDSHKRGGAVEVVFYKVIRGWAEALPLMKEGAKWKLYVPSQLAYGERGVPRTAIGPNQTLVFDVELVSVE